MKKCYVVRYLLCIFLTMCVVWGCMASFSYGYEEEIPYEGILSTDGVGGFYTIGHTDSGYTAYRAAQGQLVPLAQPSAPKITAILCDGRQVYLVQQFSNVMGIYAPMESLTELVEDVCPQNGCIAVTPDHTLYVTDERHPSDIRIYSHLHELRETITAPAPVLRIFITPDSDTVYVLTEKGVFLPDSDRLIACAVPMVPFTMNQGIACDAEGTVYRFDEINGFQKMLSINHTPLCHADGYFYTCTENTVLQLDEQGEVTARYIPTGQTLTAIAASGHQLAVLCGTEFVPCPANAFEMEASVSSEPEDPPSSLPTSHDPSWEESSSITSLPLQSVPSSSPMTVTCDTYTMTDTMITDIPVGTTLAVLRSHLHYGDAVLTVRNYHGTVTVNGRVGTGFLLHFDFDAHHTADYYTVVSGDITGEGNINTHDLRLFAQYLTDTQSLTACQQMAADLDHDTRLTLSDLYLLQQSYY